MIFTKKDIYSGVIGNSIVDSFFPFVGFAGLWLLVLIGFLITFLIFSDGKEIKGVDVQKIAANIKKDVVLFQPKISETKREKRREERLTIKEVGDTAEILIVDSNSKVDNKANDEKKVEEQMIEEFHN